MVRTAIELKPPGMTIETADTGAIPLYNEDVPEVLIGWAQTKFDAAGRLTDEAARGFIRDLLAALADWTRQIGRKQLIGGSVRDRVVRLAGQAANSPSASC